MNPNEITIREYLMQKGIQFREVNGEFVTKCIFSNCDNSSSGNEGHLYFNKEGLYHCKKCDARGNFITLKKHFDDTTNFQRKSTKFNAELVETCHLALPPHIRAYLNARGITDAVVDAHKLGWGKFYSKWWITIPIQDIYGAFRFFKLRQDPSAGNDKTTYPNLKGEIGAQIYGWGTLAG